MSYLNTINTTFAATLKREGMLMLPRELTPDPLLISTVEVRYTSEIDPSTLLSIIYPAFSNVLPMLKSANSSEEQKGEENQYFTEHVLSNEQYSLGIGRNIVVFENVGKYPLWGRYFEFISEQVNKLFQLGIIGAVQRVGVRYASLFENIFDPNRVLKSTPTFGLYGQKEELAVIRTDFKVNEYNIHLQVFTRAMLSGKEKKAGMIIDVDASLTKEIPNPRETVLQVIDELHSCEKELFFQLLKPEFINELKPTY